MKYMTAEQAGQCGRFIKLPCDIFDSQLSPLAKLLYAYLLNLTTLSVKNGLCDQRGVYVYCTLAQAAQMLDCNRDTARRAFQALEKENWIYRQFRNGSAFQIYILDPSKISTPSESSTPSKPSTPADSASQPVEKFDDSHLKNTMPPVENFDPIYTNTNYTDSKQTEENQTASSPPLSSPSFALPVSEMADKKQAYLLTKAKCRMSYFSRLAEGESKEVLDKELQQQLAILLGS